MIISSPDELGEGCRVDRASGEKRVKCEIDHCLKVREVSRLKNKIYIFDLVKNI